MGVTTARYVLLAAAALAVTAAGSTFQRPASVRDGYTGSAGCAACHASIAASYAKVSMARTFSRISDTPEIEDWTGANRFFHEKSNQHFEMAKRNGKYFQKRYRLDRNGQPEHVFEQEIHFVLGSGNKERDYLHRSPGGVMTQLPVVWYSGDRRWGMSPGYDQPQHDGFTRRINFRCFGCHNAVPDVPVSAARYEAQVSIFPPDLPSGIDCERCHGPGQRHADAASNGADGAAIRSTIVNPRRLPRNRQLDICMQCHLETTSIPLPNSIVKSGRGLFSFQPGEDLRSHTVHFDFPEGAPQLEDFNIVHQAYRLRRSMCFTRSAMTCSTCHDPHQVPENKPVYFNGKCASCHEMNDCQESRTVRSRNGDNCTACHMPQRRTDDVVHDVMTDHFIQRRVLDDPLALKSDPARQQYRGELRLYFPERESDLYLGMAYARGADPARGVRMLERIRSAGIGADVHFQEGAAHQGLGQTSAAIAAYRRAVSADPRFAEARFNLGLALLAAGDTDGAILQFEQALQIQPALDEAHVALAGARLRRGDAAGSQRHNIEALRLFPAGTLAMNNLGLLYAAAGRTADARRMFADVLRVDPDDAVASREILKLRP